MPPRVNLVFMVMRARIVKECEGPTVPSHLALSVVLRAMLVWIGLVSWHRESGLVAGAAYAMAAVLIVAGAAVGRLSERFGAGAMGTVVAAASVAVIVFLRPFYSNAEAAVGVQLVALSGLLLAGGRTAEGGGAKPGLAVAVGAVGTLLALRSRAALFLVMALSVVIVIALRYEDRLSISVALGTAAVTVGSAILAVLALGARSSWPAWLHDDRSLSGARHRLWGDALELWRVHPIVGGGPGSFLEHSSTARAADHLYAVHSSILQVGAELGAIGVLLFLLVLVSGMLEAGRGRGARGLIGVAAWCFLAVHSMIDHLYEFPLVCLLAGWVIGAAGARSGKFRWRSSPTPPSGAR